MKILGNPVQARAGVQSVVALFLLAGVWLQHLAEAAIPYQQYTLDWSLVSDYPEPAANLSSSCVCALLNGTCTPGCCCDSACSVELLQSFRRAGQCLPEGPPPQQLPYCVPAEPFAKVNLPAGDYYLLQQRAADSDFISQVLCVTADHNPSLGKSYPDPPAGDTDSNAQEAACPAAAGALASSSGSNGGYGYGQALVVVGAIPPAAAGLKVRGELVLPVGVLSAECVDLQQVGYMMRLPASLKARTASCQRTFSTAAALTAMCSDATSALSPTYWSGLEFPARPTATQLSDVTVTSLMKQDLVTGAWTQLDPVADLAAPAAAVGPPVACSGVVVEAHFLMRTSSDAETGALQLASIQLSLVLADVAMPASGPLVVTTAFSVNWANASVPDTMLQPLSGAPGYLPGFPLLAGLVATSPAGPSSTAKTAVARLTQGLQLPGPGPAGRCSPSPVYAPSIGFGYNYSSSCTIGLALAQLRSLCTANDPGKMLTDILGAEWLGNLTSEQVVLGIWGNANPNNIKHWLPLTTGDWPPSAELQWDEPTTTCHNMATGLQLRLLTGVAYAEGNLQSKLLYATACFSYSSWRFDRLNGPLLQLFELSFKVSFVPKAGQQPAVSVKPAPPLIAPLPPDLFYPFLTSGAASTWGAGPLLQLVKVLGVLLSTQVVAALL